jgi:hypothetical protein
MFNFVDEILRQLVMTRLAGEIGDVSQVSFEPPDEDFRSHVRTQGTNALNISLVDLRENRSASSATRRIDCHYLITAWSPASRSLEPTLDEHALLFKVLTVFIAAGPLVARRIYDGQPLPAGFPDDFADTELQTIVLPVERVPKLGEFWGSNRGSAWKPAIHLVVTVPLTQ